jgi:hypothetical protein
MPTNTYVALATQTLGSAAASVTFSSIPSGYTDLVLQCSLRADTSTFNNMNYPLLRFNGDSTSGLYSVTNLYARNTGGGDTAASSRSSSQNEINLGGVATSAMASGIFSTYQVQLQNYANTSINKTVLARIGTGGNLTALDGTWASVGLWRNTNAITSLSLTATSSGNFVAGSTFSLYGISAIGGVTPKATGGTVTSDATYYYHTFEMSGNFVPNQSLSCDYLVVAGGGSGASGTGGVGAGGGGAGGFRTSIGGSPLSLTAQSYPVTIGGGGASVTVLSAQGNNGSNSVFSTITSTGGGGGGYYGNPNGTAGSAGGSGGGGGTSGGGGSPAGGAASPSGQGNAGGAGGTGSASPYRGGGGGGAGAVGASASVSGNGGAGLASSITGTSITYAGGGGAGGNPTSGTGGTGGGGSGASAAAQNATAGTINTGGGGGGACGGSPVGVTGAGGSGIVIVRYAK